MQRQRRKARSATDVTSIDHCVTCNRVMKPDRLPKWESLVSKLLQFAEEEPPIEIFVLKCHLIIESVMYSFLSHRLGMQERHLPTLQFFPLAKLALGGTEHSLALTKALALNDPRNAFSHELDDLGLERDYEKLAVRERLYWPNEVDIGERSAIRRIRVRAIRTACLIAVVNVWAPIIRNHLAKRPDLSDEERDRLLSGIELQRRNVENLREKHAELQAVVDQGRRALQGPPPTT